MQTNEFSDISYELDADGIVTVMMNTPKRKNAMSGLTGLELRWAAKHFKEDDSAHAMIRTIGISVGVGGAILMVSAAVLAWPEPAGSVGHSRERSRQDCAMDTGTLERTSRRVVPLAVLLLAAGCGSEPPEREAPPPIEETVIADQVKAMDRAKAVEGQLQDAADRSAKAADDALDDGDG